jgi:hypothetical protein
MKERERISELEERVVKTYTAYKKFLLNRTNVKGYKIKTFFEVNEESKNLIIDMCLTHFDKPLFNRRITYHDEYEFNSYICEKLFYEMIKIDYEYKLGPGELHIKLPEKYMDKPKGYDKITEWFLNDEQEEIDEYFNRKYSGCLIRKLIRAKKTPIIRK